MILQQTAKELNLPNNNNVISKKIMDLAVNNPHRSSEASSKVSINI